MQDFRRLDVWQKAHQLSVALDPIAERIARRRPALADQLSRAADSIAANIAEGCGRETKADFRRFLTIAIGSTTELENHLLRAHATGFLTKTELAHFIPAATEARKMAYGLRNTL